MVGWRGEGRERSEKRNRGGRFYYEDRSDERRIKIPATFVHGYRILHEADLNEKTQMIF